MCDFPSPHHLFHSLLIHQAPTLAWRASRRRAWGQLCPRQRGRSAGAGSTQGQQRHRLPARGRPLCCGAWGPALQPPRHRSQGERGSRPGRKPQTPKTKGRAAATGRFSAVGPARGRSLRAGLQEAQRHRPRLKARLPGLFCPQELTVAGRTWVRTAHR